MSTVRNHDTVIDDVRYSAKTLPAMKAAMLLPRLVVALGEDNLALILHSGEEAAGKVFANPRLMANAFTNVAKNALSEEVGSIEELFTILFDGVRCDSIQVGDTVAPGNVSGHIDSHFSGRLMHMFKVAGWVIKLNFTVPSPEES